MEFESPLTVLLLLGLVGALIYVMSGALRRKNVISPEKEKDSSFVGVVIALLAFGLFFGAILF